MKKLESNVTGNFFLVVILFLLMPSALCYCQIVLSEIMFDPVGADYYDEFIEIYNISLTDTIDLAGWKISDSTGVDLIIPHVMGTRLKPGQYGIILDSGYFQNSTSYDHLIPPEALILTINDAAFGSNGLSNTVPEPIMLISAAGDTVAKYRYTLDNQPGYSDEKRNLRGPDTPENWANSKVLYGTPGFQNSVSQLDYDINLELQGYPAEAAPGQAITLIATVTNLGFQSVSNIAITFFEDTNSDSLLTAEEQIGQPMMIPFSLNTHESHQISIVIDSLAGGIHYLFARADFPFDQEAASILAGTIVKVGFRPGQVIINEIMYRPTGGQAEWFELYNPTDRAINLQEWQFSDSNTGKKFHLSSSPIIITNQGYCIVAEDSTVFQSYPTIPSAVIVSPHGFPALNNTGDEIFLYDVIGAIIDYVKYEPSWGSEPGISLERREEHRDSNDPSNWGLSENINGATPGFENSISPIKFDLELTGIGFFPANPFPGAELSILVEITNVGREPMAEFQVSCSIDLNQDKLFQDNERIGKPLIVARNLERNRSTTVAIPFIAMKSGCYLCQATVLSEQDGRAANNSASQVLSIGFETGVIVINEIMYSPLPGQPEWIELFNPHNSSIDIQSWSFIDSDSSGRQIITKNPIEIEPQAFLILAPDSSIFNYYDLNDSPLLTIKNFPRLNDDFDQVFIFDANNNIIDEVGYKNSWGGGKGISLERINPTLSSKDSSNWNSCALMPQGGTPGRQNSIFVEVLPGEAELTIAPNPFSPDGDGRDDVTIISYQLPFNLSQIHVKIFDIRGRLVRFLVNNQPAGTSSSIIWDGCDNEGHLCRMGIYIVYLEAIHHQKGVVKSLKKSVVLARQL